MEQNKTMGKIIKMWDNGFITLKTYKGEILRADARHMNHYELKKIHDGEHFHNIIYHYQNGYMIIDLIKAFEGAEKLWN